MNPSRTLLLATRNAKKGREMAALVAPPWDSGPVWKDVAIRSLGEFPEVPETVEDAEDFAGNARKKASEAAKWLGFWVVADDSGLAVDALGGAPGVYSARYAGIHGDDAANNRKLLEEMADVPAEDRGAAFLCTLAVSDPSGTIVAQAQASCRGRILFEGRGEEGFGYDPLFLIPEYHKTFAELGPTVKHRLSHRARAFERLRPMLERILS